MSMTVARPILIVHCAYSILVEFHALGLRSQLSIPIAYSHPNAFRVEAARTLPILAASTLPLHGSLRHLLNRSFGVNDGAEDVVCDFLRSTDCKPLTGHFARNAAPCSRLLPIYAMKLRHDSVDCGGSCIAVKSLCVNVLNHRTNCGKRRSRGEDRIGGTKSVEVRGLANR